MMPDWLAKRKNHDQQMGAAQQLLEAALACLLCLDNIRSPNGTVSGDPDDARKIVAGLARKMRDSALTLLENRLGGPLPNLDQVSKITAPDERRLAVLASYYDDMVGLGAIRLKEINQRELLAAEIGRKSIRLASSDLVELVEGLELYGDLYSLHAYSRALYKDPMLFLSRLDENLAEIEERTKAPWSKGYGAEKALFFQLLLCWRQRLHDIERSATLADQALVPVTRAVSITPDALAEVRIAVVERPKGYLAHFPHLDIRVDPADLIPNNKAAERRNSLRGSARLVAPGCLSSELEISYIPALASTARKATFRATMGTWSDSCEVNLVNRQGEERAVLGTCSVSDWFVGNIERIVASSYPKVVISLRNADIGLVGLSFEKLRGEFEKYGLEVDVFKPRGLNLPDPVDGNRVVIVEAEHVDHALVIDDALRDTGAWHVWGANVACYLQERFPGLNLQRQGLELLAEYMRFVSDEGLVEEFLGTIEFQLRDGNHWSLTKEIVESARNEAELTRLLKKKIEAVSSQKQGVLAGVLCALREAQEKDGEPGNPTVELGAIARNMERRVSDLESLLESLCVDDGLLDREGLAVYGFANSLYRLAFEQHFVEEVRHVGVGRGV